MNKSQQSGFRLQRCLLIAIVISCSSRLLFAQAQQTMNSEASTASTATRKLTLRDATDLALRNNRNIQLAQAGIDRATAEHAEARSVFWPQVLLGSGLAY